MNRQLTTENKETTAGQFIQNQGIIKLSSQEREGTVILSFIMHLMTVPFLVRQCQACGAKRWSGHHTSNIGPDHTCLSAPTIRNTFSTINCRVFREAFQIPLSSFLTPGPFLVYCWPGVKMKE
jgi:hypothetical protein